MVIRGEIEVRRAWRPFCLVKPHDIGKGAESQVRRAKNVRVA